MKSLFIMLVFFCLTATPSQVAAQEEFIAPQSKELARVPFTLLTGGIVIMQAMLEEFPDTLNFILDTGSSGISLDSTTVAVLGLKPTYTNRTIRGIAGVKRVDFLYDKKLTFPGYPGISVDSLDFHVNDYSILTAVYGERIDGIIGYSVISRYILKIDYDINRILFCSRGTIRYPRGGYLMRPVIHSLVAQEFKIKDAKALQTRLLYDMGAGLCLMLSRDFAEDSNFIDKKKKSWIKEGEGMGGKIDMELRVMKEVRVGPYKFKNVPFFIFDDETNVTNYPYMGGLIGNEILRRFNVILNYEKGDIYLSPNSHFNTSFDYSYSGIELYLIDGIIIIGDVASGSPGELAGLKEGDEVIAIDKNFNQNLNVYKTALQVPNRRVKIIVKRNGELKEYDFKVKSIL